MDQLPQVLEATLSPDTTARQNADAWLADAKANDRANFLAALASELRNVERQGNLRQQAGIQLKNCLTGQHDEIREEDIQAWLSLPEEARNHVKEEAIATLGTEDQSQSTAAQVISTIALIEIPNGMWLDVVPNLLGLVSQEEASEAQKVAGLQAVGYITNDVTEEDPDLLAQHANLLLGTVIQILNADTRPHVLQAAVVALEGSLEFCSANFEVDEDRNQIMTAVCNTTLAENEEVKVAALQCLVRISSLYYKVLKDYMEALFGITMTAMQAEQPKVNMQGIEFWTTIADEEIELMYEREDAEEVGQAPANVSSHYCLGALDGLIPLILEGLTKQSEYDDEDEWTVSKAAAVCLSFLAECCKDEVFNRCLPFIQEHLGNGDWRFRDASVLAFGNILRGPDEDTVKSVTNQALLPLLELMNDPTVMVQDSVAWMLGVICDLFPDIICQEEVLPAVLAALDSGLQNEPRVASNVCHAITFLCEGVYQQAESQLGPKDTGVAQHHLSPFFDSMLGQLIRTTERSDVQESNLRSASFEAIAAAIQFSAQENYPSVLQIANDMLSKLQNSSSMAVNSENDLRQYAEIVSGYITVVATCTRRLNREEVTALAGAAIPLLLQVMSSEAHDSNSVVEDCILCLDSFVESLEKEIAPFVDMMKPLILQAVNQVQHGDTCFAAVGIIGDICRQLQADVAPHCDAFMEQLLQALTADEVAQKVKPAVLSAFNDMALALGENFHNYLEVVVQVLKSACMHAIQPEFDDEDSMEYTNELRSGLLEAYTGIVQAMSGPQLSLTPALNAMAPHIQDLINFIHEIISRNMSDDVIRLACGLIGDLCTAFGTQIGSALDSNFIRQLHELGDTSSNPQTSNMAKYMMHKAKKSMGM